MLFFLPFPFLPPYIIQCTSLALLPMHVPLSLSPLHIHTTTHLPFATTLNLATYSEKESGLILLESWHNLWLRLLHFLNVSYQDSSMTLSILV